MSKYGDAEWVICFGYDITSPSIVSTKHYILHLLEDGKKVLWINPIPFRGLSFKKISKITLLKKIRNKLKTHSRPFLIPQKNFYVFSPFYLPSVESEHVNIFNLRLIKAQILLLRKLLGIGQYFIWTTGSFTAFSLLDAMDYKFLIYQAADLISDFRGLSPEMKGKLTKMERVLCQKSSYIFSASMRIKEKIDGMVDTPGKVIYMPHGVDYEHFAANVSIAKSVEKLPKPIAGYFGSLSDHNDQNVFNELAKNDFTVVAIGKILGDYSRCYKYKNIHFFGPIPYEILPSYAAYFDICLLNWKMAEWIRNCYPKKTLEYLALGKPVVSVKIPELVEHLKDFIYFAETPAEFVEQAQRAIQEDNEEFRKDRQERVKNETWEVRFHKVKELLEMI